MIHSVRGLSVVNDTEIDVLEKVDALDVYEVKWTELSKNVELTWRDGIVNVVKTKFLCPVIRVQKCYGDAEGSADNDGTDDDGYGGDTDDGADGGDYGDQD